MARPSRTARSEILRQIPDARANEARERKRGRRAVAARYDPNTRRIMVELSNGFVLGFPTTAIAGLADASASDLAAVEVGPGGSGLHWEALDVDVSVPGLLLSSIDQPVKARELARLAGRSTSPAKAAAARANGAKGGRPRKAAGG